MKSCTSRVLASVLAISLFIPAAMPVLAADDTASIVDQINIEYEQFTLNNGLTVLVYPDHAVPTVYVAMFYGVGSKDEPAGKTGFAHLFEHLMFQGTENREGEYFAPFSLAGATGMNGTTSQDRTNYYATVPTSALDMALWMESDRMTYLLGAIDQAALDEQRNVVKNEKRQRENAPYSMVYESLLNGLFPVGHPYHHTVIGSMEDLDNASLEDVHGWFKKYYGGTNTFLVLAGDVTVGQAKEKVAYYFGEAPAGDPLIKAEKWVPTLDAVKREKAYDRVGQTRLVRGWIAPDINDPDASLFYLMNQTLAGNKNAPLYKKLVDDLKLATNVSGQAMSQILSGLYILSIDLVPGVAPEKVWNIVDETIAEYVVAGPDSDILAAGKLGVNKYIISSMENKSSIGRQLISGALFNNDPLFFKKELKWMNAATEADMQRIASDWLGRNYYQLEVHPFPQVASSETQADRSVIPAVGKVGGVQFPEIQETTLKNGLRLVVAERSAVPLVNVQIVSQAGRTTTGRVEDSVIGEASWFLRDKGTKSYDANELAAAKDAIAMPINLYAGDENSTLAYSILTTYLDESLAIANDLLVSPTYPQDELAKFRTRAESNLANREKNPDRSAGSYYNRAIWGEEKAIASIWTADHLKQLTTETLEEFNRTNVAPSNTTIYMVGDINMEDAEKAVKKTFGKWKSSANPQRVALGEALQPKARVILVDQPGSVQANIRAGHKIDPYNPEDWTELSVMNSVFGGSFEARINMNLREDKGWSYGMRTRINRNTSGDMTLTVAGSVQIDKAAESMQEIMKEYDEFVSTRPGTPKEFNREILNGTRSIPGRYETSDGFLRSMVSADANGLPMDYAEGQANRLAALTLEGVNARAEGTLRPDQLTWVIIGDLSQMEDKIRALNYGEVEVWDHNGVRLR